MALTLIPITLREANAYVEQYHRHHRPAGGCIACVAVADDEAVRGVAIVGRPVARMLDDGWTAEVLRCCTDGARNAPSMLYGAAWRAVRALGYPNPSLTEWLMGWPAKWSDLQPLETDRFQEWRRLHSPSWPNN